MRGSGTRREVAARQISRRDSFRFRFIRQAFFDIFIRGEGRDSSVVLFIASG
jgi:hypothetical protein